MPKALECDPKCYIDGKGCALSENGKCKYLTFDNKGFSIKDYYVSRKGAKQKKMKETT